MNALVAYSINENNFVLSPERTILWEKQNTLIIADLHIGKPESLRSSGKVFKEDIQRLFTQILYSKAEKLIIVGDLTKGQSDKEMKIFKRWRNDFSSLAIHLVNGQHDLLNDHWYDELNITRSDKLMIDHFSFCHDPEAVVTNSSVVHPYTFSGHIHPGVEIKGIENQGSGFPCFYFKNSYAMLPAFSRYSGTSKVAPEKGENVFAIVENGLLQVQ